MRKKLALAVMPVIMVGTLLFYNVAYAHCPLCTAGAGAVAVGAMWLGVKGIAVGVFLGAFSIAIGTWFSRTIKKQYMKAQELIFGAISFALTIWPLRFLFKDYSSIYIMLSGDYGSLLNRTYLIDLFLIGSLIGAIIMFTAPYISKFITQKRNGKIMPYQGIIITFILLLVAAVILQFAS